MMVMWYLLRVYWGINGGSGGGRSKTTTKGSRRGDDVVDQMWLSVIHILKAYKMIKCLTDLKKKHSNIKPFLTNHLEYGTCSGYLELFCVYASGDSISRKISRNISKQPCGEHELQNFMPKIAQNPRSVSRASFQGWRSLWRLVYESSSPWKGNFSYFPFGLVALSVDVNKTHVTDSIPLFLWFWNALELMREYSSLFSQIQMFD